MGAQKLIDRDEWMTKWELAKLIGCHARRIVTLAAMKKIGVVAIPGGRKLYSRSDFLTVVEESYEPAQVGPAAAPGKPGARPGAGVRATVSADSRI